MDARCLACGSAMLSPLSTSPVADIEHLYRSGYHTEVRKYFGTDEISLLLCRSCDLRFFHPAVTGDSEFYESVSANPTYYMDEKPEFGFARSFISERDAVLEIGGGRGGFAKSLSGVGYTGLEFNKQSVAAAAAAGIEMRIESIDAHAANNRERYDVVCSFQVLEHIADPRAFTQAAFACLKPEGLLVISVPAYDSFLRSAPNLVLNMPPHHVTLWSDQALLNLAVALRGQVVQLYHEKVADYHLRWFVQCMLYQLLRRRSGRSTALIDLRRRSRARFRLAGILAGLAMPIAQRLRNTIGDEYLPNGHAAVLVVRKN